MKASGLLKSILFTLVAAGVVFVVAANFRPVPTVEGRAFPVTLPVSQPVQLPWPSYGQSAIGVSGYGVVGQHGDNKPVPIASIAKIITALAVLEKNPLATDKPGPDIVMTKADEALFEKYYAMGGSVVKVQAGQKLSQKEALQAMLIPSGNNIADSLAIWAFGSVAAYSAYANNMLSSRGLTDTEVADASGFSPKTVSTASDLAKLAELAMENQVIAEIVAQKDVQLGNGNQRHNTNSLLGVEGINGIKTGNTDEAGYCLLFAATRTVEGEQIQVVGAVLGAPTRGASFSASGALVVAADKGFSKEVLIKAGEPLGAYQAPWGGSATAVAKDDVEILVWQGLKPTLETRLEAIEEQDKAGSKVGSSTLIIGEQQKTLNVVLLQAMPQPSWVWRALQF
jgi:D-alanyl-D-alanine carboxypeptidase (penicillin-binding protein 5/6)